MIGQFLKDVFILLTDKYDVYKLIFSKKYYLLIYFQKYYSFLSWLQFISQLMLG